MQLYDAIQQFTDWRQFKVRSGTVWGYDRDLRYFCFHFGNPEIEDVTLEQVMEYLNGMKQYGWDSNSMIPKCMALRKFFEFCRMKDIKALNPELIPVPRKRQKLPRVATDQDFTAILQVIAQDTVGIRDEAIIRILWDTGARNGEICGLNIPDIDGTQAQIRTEKGVTRPFRRIFWTQSTADALTLWISQRDKLKKRVAFADDDAVFISLGSSFGKRLYYRSVSQMFLKYSKKAGLSNHINPHSFRHRMGHNLAKKGANNSVIASILGHSNITSTLTYTQMHGKELQEEYYKYNG